VEGLGLKIIELISKNPKLIIFNTIINIKKPAKSITMEKFNDFADASTGINPFIRSTKIHKKGSLH